MRRLLAVSMMAALITLAIIIGQRMSTDAMAVMVGVVFGVAASIPTSLFIALATRSKNRAEAPYRRDDYQPSAPAPQIYVVAPGQVAPGMGLPAGRAPQQLAQPMGAFYPTEPSRRYKVVGEAEYWLDEVDKNNWE